VQFANNVNNFQDLGECSEEPPTATTPTDKSTVLNDKQRRAKINKTKQRINETAKNNIHKTFQSHTKRLQELGQLVKDAILDNSLYSMMHSFEEGFSIVLYTGTHSSFENTLIHCNHEVRLILVKDMVVIWYERLLHSGARTIINAGGEEGSFKVDTRFVRTYGKNYKQVYPKHVLKLN